MSRYIGNIITKNIILPTTSAARGIWQLDDVANYSASGIWPNYSISFVDSASSFFSAGFSTQQSVTLPLTIRENDIIFLFVNTGISTSSTPPTQTTPTGYTYIANNASSHTGQTDSDNNYMYYKIAVSGDAGATLTVTNTNCDYRAMIVLVFRYNNTSAPTITIGSINGYGVVTDSGLASSPSDQTIASASLNPPFIALAGYVGTSSRSFTPTQDSEISTANGRQVRYKIFNSSPSNVTVGAVATGYVTVMQSLYMKVS